MLVVQNLTKIFTSGGLFRRGRVVAVNDISFSVKKGEIVSLVGESGSGKTTTARMILRLIPPTSGRILFEGKDIWRDIKGKHELKEYWRKVHGIFQDVFASFNPIYKVDHMLHQVFNLFNEKINERGALISEALKAVGLRPDEVLGKYPHQLSGGQRQRLMIARCFMLKPKLIVADEPTSMVDASTRAGIIKLLTELRDQYGTSIIFIVHDLGLAYYVSDRILVMYKGRIVEEGTPDEIISNPQHPYTKRLLTDIPLFYRKWTDI